MSLVVLASARGAPGVTTTTLAAAGWLRDALIVEADLAGGVVALRYGLGREPGLLSLAADRHLGTDGVLAHAQRLPGDLPVLVGPEHPVRSSLLWRRAGQRILASLGSHHGPVLVDTGRLGHDDRDDSLLTAASLILVVLRPRGEEVVAAAQHIESHAGSAPLALVVVGDGAYTSREVGGQLGCEVLGELPEDRRSAMSLEAGGSLGALRRAPLARAARGLAESIAACTEPMTAAASPAVAS